MLMQPHLSHGKKRRNKDGNKAPGGSEWLKEPLSLSLGGEQRTLAAGGSVRGLSFLREREEMSVCVCVWGGVCALCGVGVCVCVCLRERETDRERESVCVCLCVHKHKCQFIFHASITSKVQCIFLLKN